MRDELEKKILIRVAEKGKIEGTPYFGIERGEICGRSGMVEWKESTCQVFSCNVEQVLTIARNMIENLEAEGKDAELVPPA